MVNRALGHEDQVFTSCQDGKRQIHATDNFFPGKERAVLLRTQGGLQSVSERGDAKKR